MIIKSYEIQNKPINFSTYQIFLLYGENNGLKKDIRELIKKNIDKKNTNIEFLSFQEIEILDNAENLYNNIYSASLFGNTKIITINSGTDKILKHIKDISKKIVENTFLIIFSDQLEKKSKLRNFFETDSRLGCIPCYLDNQRDLELIARAELNKSNINLSRELINIIIEKANNDRENLRNEIEKIKSFALKNKNLGIDEVNAIINFTGEIKSENLINECLSGNILQYKKILSELYINTINQIFFLRIFGNKVRRLIKIKEQIGESKNIESLLNTIKPPIFWKEKPIVKKQLSIWSTNDLKKAVNEMDNIELLCKKNPEISKIIFFNFFTTLCKKASNFS